MNTCNKQIYIFKFALTLSTCWFFPPQRHYPVIFNGAEAVDSPAFSKQAMALRYGRQGSRYR